MAIPQDKGEIPSMRATSPAPSGDGKDYVHRNPPSDITILRGYLNGAAFAAIPPAVNNSPAENRSLAAAKISRSGRFLVGFWPV
jgi:hypothetical protein